MRAWLRIPLQLATVGALFCVAGAAVVTGAYFYVEPSLPSADELNDVRYATPLRIYSRDGRLITQYGEQLRTPARLADIPKMLQQAVIAAEDDRFYEHAGIDYISTARAILNYGLQFITRSEGRVAGGSTITQQITRTTDLLSREYNIGRKISEIFLAFRIEREFTKDEILQLYLNTYFFGQRSYGVVSAARTYFNKDLSELTLSEAAIIAGIPTGPSINNPYNGPENARRRRAYVLGRMETLGYIDSAARQAALREPIVSQKFDVELELEAAYIGDMVIDWCKRKFGDYTCRTAGLKITTTIDSRAQRSANLAVRSALVAYDRNHGYRGAIGHFDLASLGLAAVEPESGSAAQPDAEPERVPGQGIELDRDAAEVLNTLLGDYPERFGAEAGVVLAVGETEAEIYFRSSGRVLIGLEAVAWARPPWLNNGQQTAFPDSVDEVLEPGDIVRFRLNDDGVLELAQVPEKTDIAVDIDNFVEGALVSIDPMDGAVVALTGGYDHEHSPFNRAATAKRQPGSSFKPFFYLSALNAGYTLSTVINDAPETYYDPTLERMQTVKNYGGRYHGPTRLRNVLINSLNASADRVIRDIGASYVAGYVRRFGLDPTQAETNASLALGSMAVTPLQLATAYTVLANGGYAVGIADAEDGKVKPYFVQRAANADGDMLYDASRSVKVVCPELDEEAAAIYADDRLIEQEDELFPPRLRCAEQVESPQRIWLITDVLKDVIQRGSGVRARDAFPGRADLAGKTGTTNGPRDAWFAGFNADLVAVARVGFDDDTRDLGDGEQGGRTAIPAWIDYMKEMIDGRPEHELPRPPGIEERRINPETGLLAADCNRDTIWEFYFETLPEKEYNTCFVASPGPGDSTTPSGGGSESLFQ